MIFSPFRVFPSIFLFLTRSTPEKRTIWPLATRQSHRATHRPYCDKVGTPCINKEQACFLINKRLSYVLFEYRPQHQLIRLRLIVDSLPTSLQCLYRHLIDHGHFTPHPLPTKAERTSMNSRK